MTLHAILLVIHILSAVVWLGFLPADLVLRSFIKDNQNQAGEKKLISLYLKLTNYTGIIGMTGILVTGILLVSVIPYYFFFNFSSNHWLATKQIIMVILLLLVFILLIPKAKKVRTFINDGGESDLLPEAAFTELKKLQNSITFINIFVLINFLLAITKRFLPG